MADNDDIITRKDAAGSPRKIRLRPDLPEGIGESVANPGRFLIIDRPGVAWANLDDAVNFLHAMRTNPDGLSQSIDAARAYAKRIADEARHGRA